MLATSVRGGFWLAASAAASDGAGAGRGAAQSAEDGDQTHGYHVVQVVPNGPADKAGLEVFFDYITHVNGMVRTAVTIVPQENDYGFLGCSVRFCDFGGAADHIWHILAVYPNSPAETAGLQAHTDFIVGTPNTSLHEKDDFFDLVKKHLRKPLQLYVYNSEMDMIREVLLVPSTEFELARGADIVEHEPGAGQAAFAYHKRASALAGGASGGAGSRSACTAFFVDASVHWLAGLGEDTVEGKLSCPKCDAKVGSYHLAGIPCSCGTWVAPAYSLIKTKVDAVVAAPPPVRQ
nr:Golgi reassembly-stacking protein 2 [Polyrhizophydium stewartii]